MHQHQMLTRKCDTCGYLNPAEATICLNCTASLGRACPACGHPVAEDSKFCGKCGTRLVEGQRPLVSPVEAAGVSPQVLNGMPAALAEKIKTASVKLPGERRDVTVLLVELMNYRATTVPHPLDSESVYLFIDEAIALLADVVYKYDGTIDKFTGDGLMILFGAPAAHENDPELAIRAALDMLSALQPLSQRLKEAYGFEIQLRIGISTGDVIAGRMGNDLHMEYTVVGDTVNRAIRLKEAAEPGMILVSPETQQRTRTIFTFETVSAGAGSGDQEPMPLFRPLELLKEPDQKRGLAGLQLPMVGRTDHLARLEQALEAVRYDKQRRIILLAGEAGIGKSRLVAEFRHRIAQLDVRIYQNQCLAYTRTRPLWVVAELLRQMIGLTETDPAGLQHEAIQRYLDHLAQDEVRPYLANVLGLAQVDQEVETRLSLLEGTMLQRQIHVALRRVFLAEAQRASTIFIFEDLQWVDPASREFLEYLLQNTGDAPLMMVLVSRHVESKTTLRSLLAAAEQEAEQFVVLHLDILSDTESQLLVDQVIKDNTPEAQAIKQKIVQRGEGNPFYVGEIIRILIDQGGLDRKSPDEDWQVTPQATAYLKAVPGTVKDLLLARFDRLPEGLRRTLQLAAVLGATFPAGLLRSLSGLDADTLAIHLDELEARQLISSESFNSEEGYVFQHALIQEVVYSTLLKRDRHQIHTQVAQAIAQSDTWPADEKAERLGYHYFESTQPVKATPYLMATAEKATRRCAHEIAIEQYRQVMSLLPDRPDERAQEFFQVRIGLGRSLKYVGDFAAAGQLLGECLQLVWQSSLANQSASLWPVLVEILRQLADIHQREGSYNKAMDFLESGLQVLGETGAAEQPQLWCQLIERQAWIHFRQGRLEQAFALADSAVQRLDSAKIDDPIMQAKLFNTLGGISWQQGHREQAVDYVKRSLQLHQGLGYVWGVANAYSNLGLLHDVLGNWSNAVEYHEQAYALRQSIGDLQFQATSLDNLGILHMGMGEHQLARQELEAGLNIRQKLGDRFGIAQSQASLAELAVIQARFADALTHAETALSLADTIESPEIQVYARWILALIQVEQGELEPGLKSAEQALEMARQAGFGEGEIDCLRVLGMLRAQAEEHQEAEALFGRSVELAIQQNDPFRQGLAFLESGRLGLSLAQSDQPGRFGWKAKAVVALNQAIQKFESLGAAHHQGLAQTLLSRLQSLTSTEE